MLSDMSALEAFVMDASDSAGYDTSLDYDRRFVFDRVRGGDTALSAHPAPDPVNGAVGLTF